jgi:hypothetical protein
VTLLDYGAGNVRSVRNAIKKLGWTIKDVSWEARCWALPCLPWQAVSPPRQAPHVAPLSVGTSCCCMFT